MTDKHISELRDSMEFWVNEATNLMEIIEDKHDIISMALEVASLLRDFYIHGQEDGFYKFNNSDR